MFTDCPSCERLFRIRAAQLGAADGWVRCGNCGETYYALERLYDTPVKQAPTLHRTDEIQADPPSVTISPEQVDAPAPRIAPPDSVLAEEELVAGPEITLPDSVPAEEEAVAGPEITLPDSVPAEEEAVAGPEITLPDPVPAEEEAVAGLEITLPDSAPAEPPEPARDQPATDESAAQDSLAEQPAETVLQPDDALTAAQEIGEVDTADAVERQEALPDLPPVLADDTEKQTGSSARIVWGSLVAIFSVAAAVQLAWFNRDRLLHEFPELAPLVENICERWQCEPIRFRDISAIRLLDREVSQHPRYRDALLASATMVSDARFTQPYPDVELVIFATDGQVISRGRFEPEEYLDREIGPAAGMSPGAPVHFELELVGAAQEAVSFRFRFH